VIIKIDTSFAMRLSLLVITLEAPPLTSLKTF